MLEQYKTLNDGRDIDRPYLYIPSSIILNKELDAKRVAAYAFFLVYHGRDMELMFSLNALISWCGYVPNAHTGRMNEKFIALINELENIGCIKCEDDISIKPYTRLLRATVNAKWWQDAMNSGQYAKVYLDEIEKILQCHKKSENDTSTMVGKDMLVFAYLKMNMVKNSDGKSVYRGFYKSIASDVGLSEKSVSKIIRNLQEKGMIDCKNHRTSFDGKCVTLQNTIYLYD